jgi:hypothetical protein
MTTRVVSTIANATAASRTQGGGTATRVDNGTSAPCTHANAFLLANERSATHAGVAHSDTGARVDLRASLASLAASFVGALALALAFALVWPGAAAAAPVKLDDTGTHLSPPHLRMQWRDALSGRSARVTEAQARLSVRLDTRAYAGRQGRIYLVMPQDIGGALAMHWQGRGALMPGRITPGERVLIFQGRIPGPVVEDEWALHLVADGTWASESRRLECSFDIEWD